jgi:hypothetical protein
MRKVTNGNCAYKEDTANVVGMIRPLVLAILFGYGEVHSTDRAAAILLNAIVVVTVRRKMRVFSKDPFS